MVSESLGGAMAPLPPPLNSPMVGQRLSRFRKLNIANEEKRKCKYYFPNTYS